MNFVIDPLPGVRLSDADADTLPITSFHLVVIVEADPESYLRWQGIWRNWRLSWLYAGMVVVVNGRMNRRKAFSR